MPRFKASRKSTWVDMTAFVDVAFLILAFFMLATKFKPDEPVEINTPSSVSTQTVPEVDVLLVSIDKDGRVFFSIDNPEYRRAIIENLNSTRNLGLNESQIRNFLNAPSIGVPFSGLQSLLSLSVDQMSKYHQPGIPVNDSTGGELAFWVRDAIYMAAAKKQKLNLMIKGDNATKYPAFRGVLKAFKMQDQNKFLIVTSAEEPPVGSPLYDKRLTETRR